MFCVCSFLLVLHTRVQRRGLDMYTTYTRFVHKNEAHDFFFPFLFFGGTCLFLLNIPEVFPSTFPPKDVHIFFEVLSFSLGGRIQIRFHFAAAVWRLDLKMWPINFFYFGPNSYLHFDLSTKYLCLFCFFFAPRKMQCLHCFAALSNRECVREQTTRKLHEQISIEPREEKKRRESSKRDSQ